MMAKSPITSKERSDRTKSISCIASSSVSGKISLNFPESNFSEHFLSLIPLHLSAPSWQCLQMLALVAREANFLNSQYSKRNYKHIQDVPTFQKSLPLA